MFGNIIKKKSLSSPEEGWKPHTWYLTQVASGPNNPVYAGLFFSGFLNGPDGGPGSYSGGFPAAYTPDGDRTKQFKEYHYFVVTKELVSAEESKK